jgi:single-strand DNA-binding protein
MKQLNLVVIEGNLTRDPDFRPTDKGLPMCRFGLANNYSYKKDEDWVKNTSFFNVVAWSKVAETCGRFLKKGHGVRVHGRLDQKKYTNADGKEVSGIDLIAQSVEFLPRIKHGDGPDDAIREAA